MKRLILFELIILFLATTFESDSPPGWFQQTLPVNDQINDIFFLDSSNGWVVTLGKTTPPDTGYIMRTSNGGNNWNVQYSINRDFNSIQFVDLNTGYAGGGSGNGTRFLYKTTNGGINWVQLLGSTGVGSNIVDLNFVNVDTGWICDDNSSDGGLFKTTNGGVNWQSQLGASFKSSKLSFINKDTGWVVTNEISSRLYRTTNSGMSWNLQYTFTSTIGDVNFLNKNFGLVTAGVNQRTTDGGLTWVPSQNSFSGFKLDIVSDSVAFAGINFFNVVKTTNGGRSWFNQTSPIFNNSNVSAIDSFMAWAGGNGLVHTTDGGGPPVGIEPIGIEVLSEYKLFQNYPNPFNPVTNIIYELKVKKFVKLKVFDVTGKEITDLINREQTAGTYKVDWNAVNFPSGVYLYSLIIDGITVDTKRMVLIK